MIERMENKDKILAKLKENELTVKELADNSDFNENEVRTYIHRLIDDKLVENIGKKNRWVIYTAISKEQIPIDNELVDKLVLLMVKAGINSNNYGIDIKEIEIESNIKRLSERGLLG